MRHQFVRLFLSILLISLALILTQILILFIGNWRVTVSWKDMVFEEFASSLRKAVENVGEQGNESVVNLMIDNATERISGLLLRDGNGRFVLSLGASPLDEQLPSPEARRNSIMRSLPTGRLKLDFQNKISYIDVNIDPPEYVINVRTSQNPYIPADVRFMESHSDTRMLVSLPSAVADQDIAGTIEVVVDGEVQGYIDVLVYRMNYYAPTLFAMKELLLAFILSIPIGLVVSAILAALVSKHNERGVKELQKALSELSKGYYDVKLSHQNTEEMAQIGKSISLLAEDLERHQKSRKEWIRNISHDLNTPVTALTLLINGAMDGLFPLDEKLLNDMKKENDTLALRIQSVSYYSYLLSPDAKASRSSVSFLSSITDAENNTSVKTEHSADDTEIYADPLLLCRALSEVIQNAASYKTDDAKPVVSYKKAGDGVTITVSNNGHLPHPLPQFFEPWARGDSSRTAGGSGLGLPIVYQIMELHGGSVRIEENGERVTVSLFFPEERK